MKTILLLAFLAAALSGTEVKVYKGTSRYNSDILYTVDGHLTLEEFVAVWYAVTYVW